MTDKISHRKTIISAIVIVVAMFGFGFALVPLYDVICKITGMNGKTGLTPYSYSAISAKVDTSRQIKVQFVTSLNANMPWEFRPATKSVSVYPGEQKEVIFYAKNLSNNAMTGQAIPSISPGLSTKFFQKIECFCFNNQKLHAGEEINMPVRFVIDQELPKDVHTITLSYTMFDITQRQ